MNANQKRLATGILLVGLVLYAIWTLGQTRVAAERGCVLCIAPKRSYLRFVRVLLSSDRNVVMW